MGDDDNKEVQQLILKELEKLNGKIDDIFQRIVILETQRNQNREERDRLRVHLEEIEERIVALERWRYKIVGAAAVIGTGSGFAGDWISNLLT